MDTTLLFSSISWMGCPPQHPWALWGCPYAVCQSLGPSGDQPQELVDAPGEGDHPRTQTLFFDHAVLL